MLNVRYEDEQMIVVEKPVGVESQSANGFSADMVSEIKKHIHRLYPKGGEPYVGVIHRLDKPVGGVMVYAKTKTAAAALSKQVQEHKMDKKYRAVICGKPVDNVGNYVDYLLKDGKNNRSNLVDKGITGAKRAELSYRILETIEHESQPLTLVEIQLLTGRHHQIRVQFSGHGLPLWGDNRYNPEFVKPVPQRRVNIALAACELSFYHPKNGQKMTFALPPRGGVFDLFSSYKIN